MFTGWIVYGVNIIIAFSMSPYVIHTLGDSQYGIWTLILSLTGYFGLVEMGVVVTLGRFINISHPDAGRAHSSNIFNSALFIFAVISILIMILTIIVGYFLPFFMKSVTGSLLRDTRIILFILSFNIFIGFYNSSFAILLQANERFDIRNVVNFLSLILRTVFILVVLNAGYKLIALAIIICVLNLVETVCLFVLANSFGDKIFYGFQYIKKNCCVELLKFSKWAFVNNTSTQLAERTDFIIIGSFIGSASVTSYSIGYMLAEYGFNFLRNFVNVKIPEIMSLSGENHKQALVGLIFENAKICVLFSVPVMVGLMVFGNDFIALWMGEPAKYEASGDVTFLLAAARLSGLFNLGLGAAVWGFGNIVGLSLLNLICSLANVLLSILFINVFDMGIIGVALGTLIPMLLQHALFVPIIGCKLLKVKTSTYYYEMFKWYGVCVIYFILCIQIKYWLPTKTWLTLFSCIAISVCIYFPIGTFILYGKDKTSANLVNMYQYLFKR